MCENEREPVEHDPDGRPISQLFMDEVWEVIEKYSMSGIENSQVLGALDIVHGSFLKEVLEDKDDNS